MWDIINLAIRVVAAVREPRSAIPVSTTHAYVEGSPVRFSSALVIPERPPNIMIDELFEVVFDVILELVPTVILKIALLLAGLVAVAVGVPLLADSPLVGGALTVVGAAAVIGVLASWVL